MYTMYALCTLRVEWNLKQQANRLGKPLKAQMRFKSLSTSVIFVQVRVCTVCILCLLRVCVFVCVWKFDGKQMRKCYYVPCHKPLYAKAFKGFYVDNVLHTFCPHTNACTHHMYVMEKSSQVKKDCFYNHHLCSSVQSVPI